MDLEAQLKTSERARAFIATMTASAHGWDVTGLDKSALLGEQIYLYVYDARNQKAWMGSIGRESFLDALSTAIDSDVDWPLLRLAFIKVLDAVSLHALLMESDDASLADSPFENSNALFQAGAGFIGSTAIAMSPESIESGSHHLLIRYLGDENEMPVRYAVIHPGDSAGPLPQAEFMEAIREIIALDFATNPEWFE